MLNPDLFKNCDYKLGYVNLPLLQPAYHTSVIIFINGCQTQNLAPGKCLLHSV